MRKCDSQVRRRLGSTFGSVPFEIGIGGIRFHSRHKNRKRPFPPFGMWRPSFCLYYYFLKFHLFIYSFFFCFDFFSIFKIFCFYFILFYFASILYIFFVSILFYFSILYNFFVSILFYFILFFFWFPSSSCSCFYCVH